MVEGVDFLFQAAGSRTLVHAMATRRPSNKNLGTRTDDLVWDCNAEVSNNSNPMEGTMKILALAPGTVNHFFEATPSGRHGSLWTLKMKTPRRIEPRCTRDFESSVRAFRVFRGYEMGNENEAFTVKARLRLK